MDITLYQVDAFASELFEGNPAAVCPLDTWLSDGMLQKIGMENNLSETAFFVRADNSYRLRWFTPEAEVDLCGHATLAAAHVLFEHMDYDRGEITFDSNSGDLKVRKEGKLLKMNFPAAGLGKVPMPKALAGALGLDMSAGAEKVEVYRDTDYMVVLSSAEDVKALDPNFFQLKKIDTRGVVVTAPGAGDDTDFVSRFFAPAVGINEDPVTGSAHTMMAPYWSERLGRKRLKARQLSARGGTVYCNMLKERVELAGEAVTFMKGRIGLGV